MLYRRPKANGVVKSRNYKVNEAKNSQAVLNVQQHSISYTLSKNKAVIEEYTHDEQSDLFQVRTKKHIDFFSRQFIKGTAQLGAAFKSIDEFLNPIGQKEFEFQMPIKSQKF